MLEQEMKIPVAALDPVRVRLSERGARLVAPAALEDNWVLDDDRGPLASAGRLLRVRRAGGDCWLTLKEPGSFAGGVKSRVEIETRVGGSDEALAVLAGLGFRPVRRYQKQRESWRVGEVTVALDETPMGNFVEVEGPAARLPAVADALGLDTSAAVRGTYLDLWNAHRARHADAPADMVFPA